MNRTTNHLLFCCLTLLLATTVAFAQSVEIRTTTGDRWRGDVGDTIVVTVSEAGVPVQYTGKLLEVEKLYIVVESMIAGELKKKTVFRGDIRSLQTAETTAEDPARTTRPTRRGATSRPAEVTANADVPKDDLGREIGVFLLPLDGPVGEMIRAEEIKRIGEEADKYGRGQIIILEIHTNGGLVSESVEIDEAIQEIKKRHRVIAWVRKAISAGALISMMCDEIYFTTEGTLGSGTTLRGSSSLGEDEAEPHVQQWVDVAIRNGYSEHIARSMKLNKYMCSYDRDPVTGEVTFYGDLSGQFDLSDGDSNLTFNSSAAAHCGFSKGTADTTADFARLLDLPRWNEKSDFGRRIAAEWKETAERAKERIQRLIARRNYYKTGGTGAEERLGALIQINKELLQWWDRAPTIARTMLPERHVLEREIEELRRQLAAMRRG